MRDEKYDKTAASSLLLHCVVQSGHQKGSECSEKRDSGWRHIHAPWTAEGKPLL